MFKFQEVSYVIYFYSCSRSSGILIGTKEVFMMSLLVNKTVVVLYLKKKAMQIEWLSSFRCLVLSKRHFLKWQLPKGIVPNGKFLNMHFFKRQLPKSVLAAALGPPACSSLGARPLAHPSHSAWFPLQPETSHRPIITFGKLPLGKLHNWKVVTWGNCHLGSRPW